MIRRFKHAVRWLGIGAALAYLFDPERGDARRTAIRERATHLIDKAKGSAAQMRADAHEVKAHVESSPATTGNTRPTTSTPTSAAAVS
jgi:gas vesicle protein